MSEIDLAAIKARADAATPGPWWHQGFGLAGQATIRGGPDEWRGFDGSLGGDTRPVARVEPAPDDEGGFVTNHDADAEFIAHARTDVPALLARIAELEERVDGADKVAAHADRERERAEADRDQALARIAELEADLSDAHYEGFGVGMESADQDIDQIAAAAERRGYERAVARLRDIKRIGEWFNQQIAAGNADAFDESLSPAADYLDAVKESTDG